MPVAPSYSSNRIAPPSYHLGRLCPLFDKKKKSPVVVASLFPTSRSAVMQTYNNAMPAKKFYLNFLMPAIWYDKSYKDSFILSDRRGHHDQTPEADLQGLSEKLCTLKSLIPSQQSQSNTHILPIRAALGGWLDRQSVGRALNFSGILAGVFCHQATTFLWSRCCLISCFKQC